MQLILYSTFEILYSTLDLNFIFYHQIYIYNGAFLLLYSKASKCLTQSE